MSLNVYKIDETTQLTGKFGSSIFRIFIESFLLLLLF